MIRAARAARAAFLAPVLVLAALTACSSSDHVAARSGALPTVSGQFGTKPVFTFPKSAPPTTLKSATLRTGSGPVVARGDLLVADYLGQVWRGAVFDNSYDRHTAAGFVIGTGKVIPGWDQLLVGVRAGSRVLLSIPPAQGYGPSGNSQAGIKGTDTLVFVVDVIASYGKAAGADPHAAVLHPHIAGVTVAGPLGMQPALSISKGARAPGAPRVTVLARGHGAPVGVGLLVVQYVATRYSGASAGSTYADAPAAIPVSAGGGGTPFDLLRGVPLGSRILLQLPAMAGQGAVAVVVDLVAQPGTAAQSG
ncbi:MAG: hypothetical protein NVS3B26_28890 [Mycobacteriales bacterium]